MSRDVYAEVRAERESHASRGWDQAHDRRHGVHHLVELADKYAHRPNEENPGYYDRAGLVKAASLLVAAIELLDVVREDPL